MIEIPEASTLARQLTETISGRTIVAAVAGATPNAMAWYFGDPVEYGERLEGCTVTGATWFGGLVEIEAGRMRVCFGDGVNLRYCSPGAKRPDKHQLLLVLDDGSAVAASVRMYGGLWAFPEGMNDNPYYLVAREKPSALGDEFDFPYFQSLLTEGAIRKSAKAFLATEQRIPGLGNGVLQDILWRAKVHPKRVMATVDLQGLYNAVTSVLTEMVASGGRDTEKDLFGSPGGYAVVMGSKHNGEPCPTCGTPITRMSYMGGNVYVCPQCQRIPV